MNHLQRLLGAGSLSLLISAVVAQESPADEHAVTKEPFPQWAFPGPHNLSVPGSQQAFAWVQMFDRTRAVDWFPDQHPDMPAAVKGRFPVYACGFCHLPEGAGRPENAALAGLPYEYLKQQLEDMQSGARTTIIDPRFGPGANMMLTIKQVSKQDIEEAAKYYSSLEYKKYTKIVETTEIPRISRMDSFVYVFDQFGKREPLGERIVEGPDDFERFEMRDHRVSYTAYVPVGSIARGAALAKGDGGAMPACETCHGPGLAGSPVGPPIAGRPLTPTFRQLYAFKIGARNGATSALMKPIVAALSTKDMMDLSAYIGSLDP